MSWFNVAAQGKNIVSNHNAIQALNPANIITTFVFNQFVKPHSLYRIPREWLAEKVALAAKHNFLKNKQNQAAEAFLHSTLTKEKFARLTSSCKQAFMKNPRKHLLMIGNIGVNYLVQTSGHVAEKTKNYVTRIAKNPFKKKKENPLQLVNLPKEEERKEDKLFLHRYYTPEEQIIILQLLKNHKFSEALYQCLFFSLRPVCNQAVQTALSATIKTSVKGVCDMAAKFLLAPVVCYFSIKQAGNLASHYISKDSSAWVLPSMVSNLFFYSFAIHGILLVLLLTTECRKKRVGNDLDKAEVKQLAFECAKEPVAEKLKEIKLLSLTGINENQESINILVEALISEAVDLYWRDLHAMKWGLPLVS